MSLLFLITLCASEELKLPALQKIGGGWNGWTEMLSGIGNSMNGTEIAGFKIKTFDISQIAADLVSGILKDININEILKEYVETNTMPEIPTPTLDFAIETYIGNTTNDYIGIGIGYGCIALICIVLFVISFVYFLFYCFLCCCCCRPKTRENPGIVSNICFGIGIVLVSLCGIFSFVYSTNINNMVNTVVNTPTAIPVGMDNIYKSIFSAIESLDTSINTLADGIGNSVGKLSGVLDIPKDEIKALNTTVEKVVSGIVDGLSEHLTEITSSIPTAFEEIKTQLNKDLDRIKTNIDTVIKRYNKVANVITEEQKQKALSKIDKITIDKPEVEVNVDLGEVKNIVFKETNPQIDSILKQLEEMKKQLDDSFSGITDTIKDLNLKENLEPSLEGLKDLSDPELFKKSEFGQVFETINEYVDSYYGYVKAVLYVFAVFFFIVVAIYAAAFYTKCCCSRCIACCAECWPCATSIFTFIFGILFSAVGLVMYIAGAQLFDAADTAIDAAVVTMTNEKRELIIPELNLSKLMGGESEDGSGTDSILSHFNLTRPQQVKKLGEIKPFKALFSSNENTGFNQLTGIFDFINLTSISDWIFDTIDDTIEPKAGNEIAIMIKDMIGDINLDIPKPEEVKDMLSSVDIDGNIENGKDQVSKAMEDITKEEIFSTTEGQKYSVSYGDGPNEKIEFYPFYDENYQENKEWAENSLKQYKAALDIISKALDNFTSNWEPLIKNNYQILYDDIFRLINKYTKNIDDPEDGGYKELYEPISNVIDSINSAANKFFNGVPSAADEIKVHSITGIIGYFYNGVLLSFSNLCNIVSLICHLIFIGYFIIVVMMCIRRKGMASPEVAEKNKKNKKDKENSIDDDDNSDSAIAIVSRRSARNDIDERSDSDSSMDDMDKGRRGSKANENMTSFWLQY